LPSQASACGVIVGEGSRFRSLIVGSFILNDIITTARVNFRCLFFETRSLPTLAHCYPRSFTFYVAIPIAPF